MDCRRRNRSSLSVRSFSEPLENRLLMSVGIAADAVADRFEPNDSYEAATNLGTLGDRTENALSIHAPGNNDYFQFKAAASGAISITFTFDQARGDIDVFLLDSNRLLLDSSATTATTERLDQVVSSGQTYFIKVLGFNGGTQPAYNMIIDGPSAPAGGDADDQRTEGRTLAIGATVTDSISSGTDVDLFKVSIAAGKKLQIDVDRTSGSSLDSYLRVFNSSGSQIKSNNNANAPGESAATPRESYISYTFSTAGTYYVGVSGNPNTGYSVSTGNGDVPGSTGRYSLKITDVTPAPTTADADDQTTEARSIGVGSSISDTVANPTDVDLFKFTAKAGQKIGFDVDPASGSRLDSFLRVFNSAGSRITSNDNRAAPGETLAKSSYLAYTFTTAGTYYVGVSGAPNGSYSAVTGANDVAGSTGGYKLFLVNLTPAVSAAALSTAFSPAGQQGGSDVLLGKVNLRVL